MPSQQPLLWEESLEQWAEESQGRQNTSKEKMWV